MTRYATAFKGLRIVTLKKKDKKIQDAFKALRTTKMCGGLESYARYGLRKADIVLLAYNSKGVVKGLAGIIERDDELYIEIICNAMGKKDRKEGYATGRGLIDLIKKIAVTKKKNIELSSVNNAVSFYRRLGFKGPEYEMRWSWRPSYSRARRFEFQSVNSNYDSNNDKPRTRLRVRKVSPTRSVTLNTRNSSPTSSNRSSSNRSNATVKRLKSKASPTRSKASPTSSNRSSATVKRRKSKASPTSSKTRPV
jgi:hypothetical protein